MSGVQVCRCAGTGCACACGQPLPCSALPPSCGGAPGLRPPLRSAGTRTKAERPVAVPTAVDSMSLHHPDGGSRVTSYVVRLLTYLPGIPVAEVPVGPPLLYEIGRLAANLDETLEVGRGLGSCTRAWLCLGCIHPP